MHLALAGVSAQFRRHTVASQARCAHQARRVNGGGGAGGGGVGGEEVEVPEISQRL